MRPVFKISIITLMLILLINFGAGVIGGGNPNSSTKDSDMCSDGIYVAITINSAYYGDLDSDGYEDDIFASVNVQLECKNRYNFDYYIYLTLPSGTQTYDALGINTRLSSLTFDTTFYNWALESGDYRIDVEIIMLSGGPTLTTQHHIFDPPGGTTGVGTASTVVY